MLWVGLTVAGVGVHRCPQAKASPERRGFLQAWVEKQLGTEGLGGKTAIKQTCLLCAGFGSLETWVKTGESCPEVNAE